MDEAAELWVPPKATLPVPPRLTLQFTAGPAAGKSCPAAGLHMVVSRKKPTKANQLTHIHIKDELVSEQHASIEWTGAAWELRDVGSSNGTMYNGRQMRSNVDAVQLAHGDVLQFGKDSICSVQLAARLLDELDMEQMLECILTTVAHTAVQVVCQQKVDAALRQPAPDLMQIN